jgi:hypothetical protein
MTASYTLFLGVHVMDTLNGFSGSVRLSCSGGPAGSSCLNPPQPVKLDPNVIAYAVLGILFPPKSAAGTYTITFTGTSGTLAVVSSTAKFVVQ